MSGSRPNAFRTPDRAKPANVDEWVQQGRDITADDETVSKPADKGARARMSIDLPVELHARFKAGCALRKTRMGDEVTRMIEEWLEKDG